MECENCDDSGNTIDHKPIAETTLQMELDELVSSSSADAMPPGIIIVETCINSKELQLPIAATATATAIDKDKDVASVATVTEMTEQQQPACSICLGLKPNVQFQILQHDDERYEHPLASTEAALAAATCSAYATSKSTTTTATTTTKDSISTLRYCVDGTTQCNNLNLEYESPASSDSTPSIGSLVCRICHNADNPEQLVSPCLCKGSLTYVHVHCLERWISTSRCTTCELCQFKYNTEQTLRYSCLHSLRLWYSRAMSRRALQEDCQMFSLLTLVAFGIIGTLLVGIQYYSLHTQSWGLSKLWTKSWMLFFLFMTITVYFVNVYILIKSQLTPWYRWWQSARDIKLILENRRPFPNPSRLQRLTPETNSISASMFTHHDQQEITATVESDRERPTPVPASVTPVEIPAPVTIHRKALQISQNSEDETAEEKISQMWGTRMDNADLAAVVIATVESIADASARESDRKSEQQRQQQQQQDTNQ
ncbi:uncharacterized protein [Drosophila tropicalis]|uniref:uncharacterized protein n=1 Tax=Drosophila tropicalis TaxID=46794 RepID=UPI0035AC04D0